MIVAVQLPRLPAMAVAAHELFQVDSGIYDFADSVAVPGVDQKAEGGVPFWKSVPPTATLNGVEANPLIDRPVVAKSFALPWSHTSDPLSPVETTTVIPCAAACSHSAL